MAWSVMALAITLASCSKNTLPAFSRQHWHVDSYSGNAVSTPAGIEVAFGSEWMITDTTLIQTSDALVAYPKLEEFLARGIAEFPEIAVDSVLFYNPHRGLLFTAYHQLKPLKPTSEIYLYDDTMGSYRPEFARMFGIQYTSIDDDGWENGPTHSVYTNVRFTPRRRRMVMLQRFPGTNIAVFKIFATIPKKGKWWEEYPRGTFTNIDLNDPDNIERIAPMIQSTRSLAVDNLKIQADSKNQNK